MAIWHRAEPWRAPRKGVTNPDISPDNKNDTICNHDAWHTKLVRPPTPYTNKLKLQQIDEYGYDDKNPEDYEEDHLIPLELGGDPLDHKNLWPESHDTTPNADDKDKVENWVASQVCLDKMDLGTARHEFQTNWIELDHEYQQYEMKKHKHGNFDIARPRRNFEITLPRDEEMQEMNELNVPEPVGEEGELTDTQWHEIALHQQALARQKVALNANSRPHHLAHHRHRRYRLQSKPRPHHPVHHRHRHYRCYRYHCPCICRQGMIHLRWPYRIERKRELQPH